MEISGARLVENLRAVQSVAGAGVEVLAVVKANGYGHDAVAVAQALVQGGVRWLGVSDVEEGARVREALGQSSTRILVMCGMELGDAAAMVAHGLTPVVWTPEHIVAMERAARAAGHKAPVHLEVDTGMARQGATPGPELAHVLAKLSASRWLSGEGVMSHLSGAELAHSTITMDQQARFAAALAQVAEAGIKPELLHLGNTSAVDEGATLAWVRKQARQLGARAMVRPGLALYGHCLPLEAESGSAVSHLAARLKPVLQWKTRVVGLRDLAVGATVGYGATFVATAPMRLALLPVGYADGLRREASSGLGNGWVMLAGQRAPVVGRVSMNLTVVDVTSLQHIAVGDEVVLLGEGVTAEDHAHWCRTIPYEILCGLRAHVQVL
jgi:alanine racemase